jgi:hypothetical protein
MKPNKTYTRARNERVNSRGKDTPNRGFRRDETGRRRQPDFGARAWAGSTIATRAGFGYRQVVVAIFRT